MKNIALPLASVVLAAACELPQEDFEPAPIEVAASEITLAEKVRKYIPPELKEIIDTSSEIAKLYSNATAVIPAAELVARLLGLVDQDPSMKEEFDQLHRHLDAIAATTIAHQSRVLRETQREAMGGAVDRANAAIRRSPPEVLDGGTDSSASNAFRLASNATLFMRYFNPDVTAGPWKELIPEPPRENGLVYDWREGLPTMMLLAALRVHVMKAAYPTFERDPYVQTELALIRDRLWEHHWRIYGGVQCGEKHFTTPRGGGFQKKKPTLSARLSCADVHTGLSEYMSIGLNGSAYDPTDCPCYTPGRCSQQNLPACIAQKKSNLNQYNAKLAAFREQAFNNVMAALPLTAISDLAHRMETIRNPTP